MLLASSTEPALTLQRVTTRALDPVAADDRRDRLGGGRAVRRRSGRSIGFEARTPSCASRSPARKQRIAELAEAARENGELRQLLGIAEALDMELLPVRITSRDPSNFTWEAGVDAGTDDGVRVGMPVVANANGAGALAGTVVERHRGHRADPVHRRHPLGGHRSRPGQPRPRRGPRAGRRASW